MATSPEPSTTRVLIVDNSAPWRSYVRFVLEKWPHTLLISEASNGLECVARVQTLQPHIVLLDVDLPGMNGIEVAHNICKLAPASRILFLSLDSSTELVEAANKAGASGYLFKARAVPQLLRATLQAILEGQHLLPDGTIPH